MADRYYKKPTGTVTKITPKHNLKKIFKKGRRGGDWIECDKNGKELKKVSKTKIKKVKKSK
jgi:hypothetical protein